MNTNDSSMPQVYAVLVQDQDYYARLELCKIFGAEADAEAYAQELREMMGEPDYDGAEPEPEFALVKVEAYSVN
jgi:hypothetical protein